MMLWYYLKQLSIFVLIPWIEIREGEKSSVSWNSAGIKGQEKLKQLTGEASTTTTLLSTERIHFGWEGRFRFDWLFVWLFFLLKNEDQVSYLLFKYQMGWWGVQKSRWMNGWMEWKTKTLRPTTTTTRTYWFDIIELCCMVGISKKICWWRGQVDLGCSIGWWVGR